ncbi:MAG TPA: PhzF family phenazine biosynthesis protein [Candidatus Baltobacteraceae bacterium]|nr:PhzF family phenazine biosynthesis protein [Candidatus Baltobacteraceae bacterium]
MQHRFYTLDVFTTTRFQGNPLAVITDGDGLSQDQMQAIAREMNLSETVFVQKPTDDRALARLRIFTTKQELKLAGHPVIGTWFLLAELGVVPAQEGGVHVMQQTGAGILPVEIRFKDGRPQRVTMTQKEAAFKPSKINKKKLAESLGLSLKDLDPKLDPEFVSTGIFNLMVPLRNRQALGKIELNMVELARLLGKQGALAYCFALAGNSSAHARGMMPWGMYEDAATGSAAGSLGAYLVKHGKLSAGHTLHIAQGVEMGRPSEIEVEVSQPGKKLTPRVSGAAVKVFEGTIRA